MNNIKRSLFYFAVIISIASFTLIVAFTIKAADSSTDKRAPKISDTLLSSKEFPYEIGKSHSFKNLQLFFLSTESGIIDKEYITLSEAMERNYITVFETENVNQLVVENHSGNFIFICSGEIVKGGKQDRTIGKDIILPPKSGKVPLASLCVESGRWHQREDEADVAFSSSKYALSSRDLKVAAKKSKSQSEVWDKVSRQQSKVNESMVSNYEYDDSFDVKDEVSESSLQLTLENKELQKVKSEYEAYFNKVGSDNKQSVGFVYAINGEIYGIDIYHNYKLFNDLWPKMLDAVIVEAISELKKEQEIKYIDRSSIIAMINDFAKEKAEIDKEEINSETTYIITSTDNLLKFETLDKREENMLLHLNYVSVDSDYTTPKSHRSIQNNLYLDEENIQIQQYRNTE
ncbi:MAG: hypothetical protein JW894_06065 [Bacteroidales bacterium]|nr:hypothetical protein [Bacteroidales bacterium]